MKGGTQLTLSTLSFGFIVLDDVFLFIFEEKEARLHKERNILEVVGHLKLSAFHKSKRQPIFKIMTK